MNDISSDMEKLRDARDGLLNDLHQLSAHAQQLLQAAQSIPGDAIDLAHEKLDEKLSACRLQLGQMRQAAIQRPQAIAAVLTEHVRTHPKESVAVVSLAGLAIGWLSRGATFGVVGRIARLAGLGIAGTAGAVLWSFRNRSRSLTVEPVPVEEVGRWESEGGSPAG